MPGWRKAAVVFLAGVSAALAPLGRAVGSPRPATERVASGGGLAIFPELLAASDQGVAYRLGSHLFTRTAPGVVTDLGDMPGGVFVNGSTLVRAYCTDGWEGCLTPVATVSRLDGSSATTLSAPFAAAYTLGAGPGGVVFGGTNDFATADIVFSRPGRVPTKLLTVPIAATSYRSLLATDSQGLFGAYQDGTGAWRTRYARFSDGTGISLGLTGITGLSWVSEVALSGNRVAIAALNSLGEETVYSRLVTSGSTWTRIGSAKRGGVTSLALAGTIVAWTDNRCAGFSDCVPDLITRDVSAPAAETYGGAIPLKDPVLGAGSSFVLVGGSGAHDGGLYSLASAAAAPSLMAPISMTVDAPGWSWTQRIRLAGDGSEEMLPAGSGVAVDTQGNSLAVGAVHNSVTATPEERDVRVAKYSPSGIPIWSRDLASSADDAAAAVVTDAVGNAYLAGVTAGQLVGATSSAGLTDAFLAKVAPDGALAWVRQFGTGAEDAAVSVALDPRGNLVVVGTTSSQMPGSTIPPAGASDVFVTKFNADGDRLWVTQFGSSQADFGRDVAVGPDGSIAVAGFTEGRLPRVGAAPAGGAAAFVTTLNASGVYQWTRLIDSAQYETATSLSVDSANGVYVTGWTWGLIPGALRSPGDRNKDLFLARLTSSGSLAWIRQLPGSARDLGDTRGPDTAAVTVDRAGNAVLAGWSDAPLAAPDSSAPAGEDDVLLANFAPDGQSNWMRSLGWRYRDSAADVAMGPDGTISITGWAQGRLPGTLGPGMGFLAKYEPATQPVTAEWSTADYARLQQVAASLGQTEQELQRTGVLFLGFLLGLSGDDTPAPALLPAAGTGSMVTSVWPTEDLDVLDRVGAKFVLGDADAQRLGVYFLSFLLSLSAA